MRDKARLFQWIRDIKPAKIVVSPLLLRIRRSGDFFNNNDLFLIFPSHVKIPISLEKNVKYIINIMLYIIIYIIIY